MDQKLFPSLAVSRTNFCSHLISTKSDKYLGQEKGHKSVDRSNWNLRALFVRTKRTTWCRPPCRKPIKNCFQLASACTFGADTLCSSFHYPIPSGPQEFPTRAHDSQVGSPQCHYLCSIDPMPQRRLCQPLIIIIVVKINKDIIVNISILQDTTLLVWW